jgi:hypothetical protein
MILKNFSIKKLKVENEGQVVMQTEELKFKN